MKPVATRERLHLIIDLLPASALDGIYYLLHRLCQKKLKATFNETGGRNFSGRGGFVVAAVFGIGVSFMNFEDHGRA